MNSEEIHCSVNDIKFDESENAQNINWRRNWVFFFANSPLYFWAKIVATTCFVQNKSIITKRLTKTHYEVLNNSKPNFHFIHIFGCRCFVVNKKEYLSKITPKSDEWIFFGYSTNKVAYMLIQLLAYDFQLVGYMWKHTC